MKWINLRGRNEEEMDKGGCNDDRRVECNVRQHEGEDEDEDEDEDKDEDKEEKASSDGDESAGGMKRRWTREGEMMIDKLRVMYTDIDKDE